MGVDTLELINRRERQILVHSCLYYQFNENLIQDHVYDAWSKELAELIQNHKEEFKRSVHYTTFKDYEGQQFVKIVSDKFKETKSIKQPSLDRTDIGTLIDSVLTPQRVEKLIHKKIDLGLLPAELDITDTGNVLKALSSDVVNDIFEEEMHIFLDMLRKKISKKTPIVVRELLEKWE